MYEPKFAQMAFSESDYPFDNSFQSKALCNMRGAIGLIADNKADFLAKGDAYLKNFEGSILEAIRSECEEGNNDEELICAYRELNDQSKLIDRDEFLDLLSQDWDERH